MLKNISKNFLALTASQAIYRLFSFFVIVYVARALGDAKFGQLSFALYLGFIFLSLADLGLYEIYIYETAGNREKEMEVMGLSLSGKLILSFLSLTVLIICAFSLGDREEGILILLIGVAMILDSFTLFLRSVFRAREKMEYEAITFIAEGLLKFALVIIAVIYSKADILVIGAAFLTTSILTLVFTVQLCKVKFFIARPKIDIGKIMVLLKRGFPFMVIGFLSIISLKIDVLMLSKGTNYVITGWYSAAVKFVESVLIIPMVLAVVIFPVLSRNYRNSMQNVFFIYKVFIFISIAISIPVAVVLYLGSDFFMNVIFGSSFLNSGHIVRILCLIITPIFLKLFLERVALVLGKFDVLLKSYVGGLVLKVFLNIYCLSKLSYSWVAFSTIFTEGLIVVYILISLNKQFAIIRDVSLNSELATKAELFRDEW